MYREQERIITKNHRGNLLLECSGSKHEANAQCGIAPGFHSKTYLKTVWNVPKENIKTTESRKPSKFAKQERSSRMIRRRFRFMVSTRASLPKHPCKDCPAGWFRETQEDLYRVYWWYTALGNDTRQACSVDEANKLSYKPHCVQQVNLVISLVRMQLVLWANLQTRETKHAKSVLRESMVMTRKPSSCVPCRAGHEQRRRGTECRHAPIVHRKTRGVVTPQKKILC